MKPKIKILDLFAGIGGFLKGIEQAGFEIEKHYFSEIDKHAVANYSYNFKSAQYVGSVTNVRGTDIERPNIITFGSPCQDFSLAGKRTGLEGQRSNLILEAIRLISELRPDFFIWENVKGAFSSNNGSDFIAILQAFANIGGYRLEWQLVNTAWLLPQNRERIYLVGHLAESGRSFRGVFPFRESDFRLNERASNSSVVRTITAGGKSGGHHSGMTLIKKAGQINSSQDGIILETNGYSQCLSAGHGNVPKIVNRAHGFFKGSESTKYTPTLNSKSSIDNLTVHVKCGIIMGDEGFRVMTDNISPTLCARARTDGSGQPVVSIKPVLTSNRLEKRQNGRRFKEDGEPAFTLNCQDQHGVMIDNNIRRLTEVECERLQGFPDNWTKFGIYDGQVKQIPKTQRYKMCGNAVTVNIVQIIAKRILKNYFTN